MRHLIWCCWLFASPAFGASVELPPEVRGEPGNFLRIPAKTDCIELRWVALDPGLNLFPTDLLKDSRTAVAVALKPGKYRLLAYGAKDNQASEPAFCTVVIATPPEPQPEDDLTKQLRAAYRDESSPQKQEAIRFLAQLYRTAAEKDVQDSQVKTVIELLYRLQESRRKAFPDAVLIDLRRVIEKELNRELPINPSTILDATLRQKAARIFLQIASRLETLP